MESERVTGSREPSRVTPSRPVGLDPARFPGKAVDQNLCIGIVNPYGELWTWDAFPDCDAAERHLRDFWGDQADEMMRGFSLCMVSVEVIPESEPFDLPSASGIEASGQDAQRLDAKHESPPGRPTNAAHPVSRKDEK